MRVHCVEATLFPLAMLVACVDSTPVSQSIDLPQASVSAGPGILHARATIEGIAGSGIRGVVELSQIDFGGLPEVVVDITIEGLAPNSSHGFHVHQRGLCEAPGFVTSGGHFDPGPASSSSPDDANHPFHMGDLSPITAGPSGRAHARMTTNRVSLSPGPLSVFDLDGSSVIVHSNPDMLITGPPGSGVSGGPRVACGIVEVN